MNRYVKSIINILLYFAIYSINILIVLSIGLYLLNLPNYFTQILGVIAQILTIILYIWLLKTRKDNLFIRCNFALPRLRDIIYPILVILAVDFLIIYIHFKFSLLPNVGHLPSIIALSKGNQFVAFLILNLTGPIFEGIFYRGMIFNELKKNFPIVMAIILQALIFSICHQKNQMIYAFIAGILFAVIYLWFKTIWAPIIAQIINYNVFLYSSTLIKLDSSWYGLPYKLPMLLMVLASIYLIWKNKDVIFNKPKVDTKG